MTNYLSFFSFSTHPLFALCFQVRAMATATEKENEVYLEDASSGDPPTDGVQPIYDEMNLQAFLAIVVSTN